jgi:orotidine-5'-phosphate decarboxylase
MLDVGGEPLYLKVAEYLASWARGKAGELGFVVGATDPEVLEDLRARYPEIPVLIPGIGAQGGEPGAVMRAVGVGSAPVIVNASRSILYASSGPDYAERARSVAKSLRDQLKAESTVRQDRG